MTSPVTRRSLLQLGVLTLTGGLVGCEDEIIIQAPTAPEPPPATIPDRVELRVIGSFRSVTVRHVNAQDGSSRNERVDLPYFASFTTLRDSMFISLEAFAVGEGWLQVQILVNGFLLQEATSSSDDPRLAISVTFRHSDVVPPPTPRPV
jgi:hypothetical protein